MKRPVVKIVKEEGDKFTLVVERNDPEQKDEQFPLSLDEQTQFVDALDELGEMRGRIMQKFKARNYEPRGAANEEETLTQLIDEFDAARKMIRETIGNTGDMTLSEMIEALVRFLTTKLADDFEPQATHAIRQAHIRGAEYVMDRLADKPYLDDREED